MSPKRERDLATLAPRDPGFEPSRHREPADPFLSFIASQLFPQIVATIADHRAAERALEVRS